MKKERKREKKREKERERERERNREKERNRERKERKRCSGSIIINLHSILKKEKLNILVEMLKISKSGCCCGSIYYNRPSSI